MRYKIAEMVDDHTAKLIKGMTFKRFESAIAIGIRLAETHKDTTYIVVDTETKSNYKIQRENENQ